MDTTNNFLVSLLADLDINNSRLVEILVKEGKNTNDILRIFSYLNTGEKPKVPQKHVEKNGEVYTFVDYNIYNNLVTFSYTSTVTCYLKEGEEFDENNVYNNFDDLPGSTWKRADAIEVNLKYIKRSTMTLEEWIKN